MTASHDAAAKRKHAGSRLDALLGALTCVLLTALTLSASAAGVSVNATAYANNDITVNTINSGLMVMMIANAQPSAFNPRTFVVKAYPLYAAADGAIVSMNNVIIVNWCAKKTNELNSSMSCADGRELNNVTYPYVLIQMRFPAWAGSKLAEPSLVDLSSLNVVKQLAVKSLPGIYDPDTNKTSGGLGYITEISYNTAAVYAVFGVLLGIVVIVLVVTIVCVCRTDRKMATANKSIIDRAINTLRSDRNMLHTVNITNIPEHNVNNDASTAGPVSSPMTLHQPREGNNTYSSPPANGAAMDQEMQEIKARQMPTQDVSNLQKPAP
ncbi:hypothetical protein N2W54_004272 [Lotmaria passim]